MQEEIKEPAEMEKAAEKWLKNRKPDCRKDRRSHVYRTCGRNRAD